LTPETHPDYKELPKALQSIEEVANTVNNCLRKHENLTKLQEVIRNYGYPKEVVFSFLILIVENEEHKHLAYFSGII
jgi:hypothetical protein